jgi:putative FmdB family regulatory protein
MPIYEYRCEECGHQEDHLQKISEAQLSVCPACNKPSYKKQLSAAGFQLKGSGWYATDFKSAGKKPVEKKADSKIDDRNKDRRENRNQVRTEAGTEEGVESGGGGLSLAATASGPA